MMQQKDKLPPDQQEEYILLERQPQGKDYKSYYGWLPGTKLIRRSVWLSGNGAGVRQAYFSPVDRPNHDGIVWEDHVRLTAQVDLFDLLNV